MAKHNTAWIGINIKLLPWSASSTSRIFFTTSMFLSGPVMRSVPVWGIIWPLYCPVLCTTGPANTPERFIYHPYLGEATPPALWLVSDNTGQAHRRLRGKAYIQFTASSQTHTHTQPTASWHYLTHTYTILSFIKHTQSWASSQTHTLATSHTHSLSSHTYPRVHSRQLYYTDTHSQSSESSHTPTRVRNSPPDVIEWARTHFPDWSRTSFMD